MRCLCSRRMLASTRARISSVSTKCSETSSATASSIQSKQASRRKASFSRTSSRSSITAVAPIPGYLSVGAARRRRTSILGAQSSASVARLGQVQNALPRKEHVIRTAPRHPSPAFSALLGCEPVPRGRPLAVCGPGSMRDACRGPQPARRPSLSSRKLSSVRPEEIAWLLRLEVVTALAGASVSGGPPVPAPAVVFQSETGSPSARTCASRRTPHPFARCPQPATWPPSSRIAPHSGHTRCA